MIAWFYCTCLLVLMGKYGAIDLISNANNNQDVELIENNRFVTTVEEEDIIFRYYSRTAAENGKRIFIQNVTEKTLRDWKWGVELKVVTHGWLSSGLSSSVDGIKNAYLKMRDLNVVTVDWSDPASWKLYPLPAYLTRQVGALIARLIDEFVHNYKLSTDDVHIIGHSLGSHVAGAAGSATKTGKVFRITGLDPAGPGFEYLPITDDILDKSDAHFVDIIHTAGKAAGYFEAMGHADFYPNGGIPIQPGCSNESFGSWFLSCCSHGKAYEYYADSILYPYSFKSYECQSWEAFQNNSCYNIDDTAIAFMGDSASPNFAKNMTLGSKNWMVLDAYVKKEFKDCQMLLDEELIIANGYNEYANYLKGKLLQEEGKVQNSMKFFEKCVMMRPRNVEYLKQIGRSLYLQGRYEFAVDALLNAEKISENCGDWNIHHNLGVAYGKKGKYEKAQEYLKKSIMEGKMEQTFVALADLHMKQNDLFGAIDVYVIGLKLYPSSIKLSINLGLLFMDIKQYSKAFNQLGTSLSYEPSDPEALFTFSAEIQRHGEYDVALTKYKIEAERLPECPEMWNNIGMCYFGNRKYVAAISCLKRSTYLSSLNWITFYNLGLLHLNMKQNASAAIFFTSAAKLYPRHGPTFVCLGLALKQLDDTINCRRSFNEALKKNENDTEICAALESYLIAVGDTQLLEKLAGKYGRSLDSTEKLSHSK